MDMIKIANRIKEVRVENKLSQLAFGKLLSVSQDTISLWETGKSVPTAESLIAMAKNFDVSVDYILCLKDF